MPFFAGPPSQSSSNAGPSLPPRKAKTEEQSGVSEAQVAQPQTRQQGIAASTPQGNGLPNGAAPSALSSTGNGPARGGALTPARNAGPVISGGAGGDSSRGAIILIIQAHALPPHFLLKVPSPTCRHVLVHRYHNSLQHACLCLHACSHACCCVCAHVL